MVARLTIDTRSQKCHPLWIYHTRNQTAAANPTSEVVNVVFIILELVTALSTDVDSAAAFVGGSVTSDGGLFKI